jgi:putative ABC transport system ATP-binding protein
MTENAALELRGVTVSVPDGTETLTILDGLDLTVGAGEIVMVTGASGSGKSTLLAVGALLRQPTSGTVYVDGVDTSGRKPAALAKLRNEHLGMVFQSSNLFPSLTALQQIELVAHIGGRLDRAAKERARALLDAVGLADRADRLPAQLSGGERQRVGIARALMNDPEVLLADEPTASLDEDRGREVMSLLVAQAKERGMAALIVTHTPDQLTGFDRHLHLQRGRLGRGARRPPGGRGHRGGEPSLRRARRRQRQPRRHRQRGRARPELAVPVLPR